MQFAAKFIYLYYSKNKSKQIKRIIVVIPFNTITTQTASVLRGIVGEKNILENHSGFDFEDSKQGKLLQYASENWDIPIVVTTNVQFFESFFSNKPAKSRKLHNIADSVIIFDEVQQLPVKYLKPCIKCIESLAANFGARIVLSTATQPALEPYFETIKPREIIDDSESYVKPFRRCSIENIGTVTAKNLTERIQKHKQCLCVVNEKEEAKAIYGLYHMYIQTSTKAILRNGVTEDDLKLLIQTILHMFDDDMSSVRPSMTVRKVVVVRQNRNSGRVRPTDIEDAMVAKLKPGVNNPTSFNDYDLEFKRDMLPDSVEVKEYTMDNPDGVIL